MRATCPACIDVLAHRLPRLRFEKIQEKLLEFGARNNWCLRKIAAWAKRKVLSRSQRRTALCYDVDDVNVHAQGVQASQAVDARRRLPWGFWLANNLVFKRVATGLGLQRCRCVALKQAWVAHVPPSHTTTCVWNSGRSSLALHRWRQIRCGTSRACSCQSMNCEAIGCGPV